MSCVNWTQVVEWLKLFISPLGAVLGAFIGAYLATHWTEKRRTRREHFDRLKNAIFSPWKADLSFHNLEHPIRSNYGSSLEVRRRKFSIEDNVLFEDVKNHFPDLSREWVNIKRRFGEYYTECSLFAQRIEKILTERTGLHMIINLDVERGFLHDCVRIIFHTLIDRTRTDDSSDKQFKIKKSGDIFELTCNGTTLAQGTQEEMQNCKIAFNEILELSEYKATAKSLVEKIEIIRNDAKKVERKLSQIIEATKLPRDCTYI